MNPAKAQEVIEQVFRFLDWKCDQVVIEKTDAGEWYINVESEDVTSVLGGHSENLIALQHLLKNIFRSQSILEEGEVYRIDVGGYRKKQEENVLEMARKRAEEVQSSGKPITLPPMSPYFRRLVHLEIAEKFPELETSSTGVGDYRAVRIVKK